MSQEKQGISQAANRETKLSHDIAFVFLSWGLALICLGVQRALPVSTHWFLRGCIFYVSMVVPLKPMYALVSGICQPGKIVQPGFHERERAKAMPIFETIKGFTLSAVLRALTFAWAPAGFLALSTPQLVAAITIKTFVWTVVYDFFYYWVHRLFHVKGFYRFVHAKHHSVQQPYRGITLLHTVSEMVFEILTPTLLAQMVFPLTDHELIVAYVNIQLMEVAGHSGTAWKTNSFGYLPWLPRLLHIDLRVEDHDAHHALRRVNFAKQLSLWDKVFGTHQNGHNVKTKLDAVSNDAHGSYIDALEHPCVAACRT